MSGPTWTRATAVTRDALLEGLAELLATAPEPLRIVARGIQGEGGEIDAVACDPQGAAVVVGYAEAGRELQQLGHLLAQRAWLAPRIRDWLQLNPQLPLREGRTPRVLLLAQEPTPATLSAASEVGGVAVARVLALESEQGLAVGLEPVSTDAKAAALLDRRAALAPTAPAAPPPQSVEPVHAVPEPGPSRDQPLRSSFRTGLDPSDLRGAQRPRSAPRGD